MLLITGSSGLIGTNLALRLLDHGYDVLGVDLRSNPWTDRVPTVTCDLARPCDDGTDVLGDTISRECVDVERIDGVIHLAAIARVYQSVCEPDNSLRNLRMVHSVLEFCRRHRFPLIFSSSREIYGNIADLPGRVDESHAGPARIASPYAAGKFAAEAYISSYARCFDLPTLIARLSNVYGRFDSDIERIGRVIPLFIRQISSGIPVTIFGSEKVLDFTHVDDCVRAIHLGIERLFEVDSQVTRTGVAGRTLNIATGQGHSIVELANLIGRELGVEPYTILVESRPGEVRHYVADVSAADAFLGYRPTISLPEGIARAVAWWKQNVRTVA
jgi:UDP-glucose 4-epimerase